jgi:hypothetical protein
MNNLSYVLTRDAAIELFADCIMPMVVHAYEFDGHPDWIARSEAWNNWTDGLCQDGRISLWQYENWSPPDVCGD